MNGTPGNILTQLLKAVRLSRLLEIEYNDGHGRASTRRVQPLALTFYPHGQILGAYCLLREDFRQFRIDRIASARETGENFGPSAPDLVRRYRRRIAHDAPPEPLRFSGSLDWGTCEPSGPLGAGRYGED